MLLGGWSTAGGISEDMKPQGFGGSVCEKPVDQHCEAKTIPGTLSAFEANSRGVSGHLLLDLMGNSGNWRTLLMAFLLHQNLPV